jgi:hypothetical protein
MRSFDTVVNDSSLGRVELPLVEGLVEGELLL